MKTIDVDGLPEAVAQALQAMVDAMRRQGPARDDRSKAMVRLPEWPGRVLGSLRREDIYADVR